MNLSQDNAHGLDGLGLTEALVGFIRIEELTSS
jgi:hypothetical protein